MPVSVPMLRDRFRRGRAGSAPDAGAAGSATGSATGATGGSGSTRAAAGPTGRAYEEPRDWARVGMFGAGILVGSLLGAGIALLYAPQSGIETRLDVRRKARRLRAEAIGRLDDVTGGVRDATRRGKKRVRRSATRARWAAADVFER